MRTLQDLLNAFYDDFEAAVAGKGKLTYPGEEGRNVVEHANAMKVSSVLGKAVRLPLNRQEYSKLIARMIGTKRMRA